MIERKSFDENRRQATPPQYLVPVGRDAGANAVGRFGCSELAIGERFCWSNNFVRMANGVKEEGSVQFYFRRVFESGKAQ